MIKFTNDINQIIKLWQEAFGDSEDEIMFFVDNAKEIKCLGYFDDNTLASMLFIVSSNLGKYIYAACTLKSYQSKGYMSKLLDYCKNNYSSLCLIPANEDLINYYNARGFNIVHSINDLSFNQSDEIIEYLFAGCELKNPIALQYKGDN